MFLVLVDAYSKWIEIFIIKDITRKTIINNGRQFVSGEFEQFTKMNGIRHTKTSPYNPKTNLQSFLFAHRAFPQTVIKEFPGGTANEEKFKIKILEFNTKMRNPREVFHENVRRQEQFTTGCEVYFRNYATGQVTSGNKEETASVHVPSCTPIPGPVAVHVPSCTPKPEAAAVQVPVRSPRPQRARKPLDRLESILGSPPFHALTNGQVHCDATLSLTLRHAGDRSKVLPTAPSCPGLHRSPVNSGADTVTPHSVVSTTFLLHKSDH
ncbi:K02A2.6-like [Cordylochernes scorpioides]|uniref:K02A2.6-like n=1 Tax=Cordylochernes scorpioides TaxID=51811 RepID=A0ABY6JWK0_9ARAC|nr:K02A2.6-like [Cordylochernes scorpioides]